MMKYYKEYISYTKNIEGKKKLIDTTIYTFDIETTSYFILNNNIYSAIEYKDLNEKDKQKCEFKSCMYIWMLSIDYQVYYGRTWKEFLEFLNLINNENKNAKKIIFVHNLSFEFQYLKSYLPIKEVTARKKHKVMKFITDENLLNFEFRCSYYMSNVSLDKLADIYDLSVKKLKRLT